MKKRLLLLIVTILGLFVNTMMLLNFKGIRYASPIYFSINQILNILFWIALAIYTHYKRKPVILTILLLLPIPLSYLQSYIFRYVLSELDFSTISFVGPFMLIVFNIMILTILLINYIHKKNFILLFLVVFQLFIMSFYIFEVSFLVHQVVFIIRQFIILFLLLHDIKYNKESLNPEEEYLNQYECEL